MGASRPLSRVAAAADRVRRAEHTLQAARAGLHDAIVAARDSGETLASIARVLGVSRQRVKQIVSD